MMLATLREVNHEMQRYSHRQLMLLIQNSLNKMAKANTTINSANSLLTSNQSVFTNSKSQSPAPTTASEELPVPIVKSPEPMDTIPILKSEPVIQEIEIFETSGSESPESNVSPVSSHCSGTSSTGTNHSFGISQNPFTIPTSVPSKTFLSNQNRMNNLPPVQNRPLPAFPGFSGNFSSHVPVPVGNSQPMKTDFSDFQQYQLPSFY